MSRLIKTFFKFVVAIVMVCMIATSITYIGNYVVVRQDFADPDTFSRPITFSIEGNHNTVQTTVQANEPVIKTADGNFDIDGINIVKSAATYLGTSYAFEEDVPVDSSVTISSLDCSGFVLCALRKEGITTDGFHERSPYNIPRSVIEWLEYEKTGGSENYFYEVGSYKLSNDENSINFVGDHDGEQVKNVDLKVKIGNSQKSINVLKANDPIGNELRWYQYYDNNNQIQNLPIGTIVCNYGDGESGSQHMWIAIGDLGTDNKDEAIEKLKNMGILTDESDTTYVSAEDNGCTYWRIEATDREVNGVRGVKIDNHNPSLGTNEGGSKKTGTIWAYQIANDIDNSEGTYSFGVVKRYASDFKGKNEDQAKTELSDKTKAVGGAKFTLTQQLMTDEGLSELVQKTSTTQNACVTDSGYGEVTIYENGIGNSKQDIYTIVETEAPSNCTVLDLSNLKINVYKKKDGNTYKVDYIVVTDYMGNSKMNVLAGDKNIIDIDNDSDYDFGIEIDSDGGTFTITAIDKEVEKKPTDIEIHKGVKNVKNQDSGYYTDVTVPKVAEYVDETAEKTYSEIELEQLYHEWVIETTIPEDVDIYEEYSITDCIDTTKLDFSGLERVKVELVSQNEATTKLVKDQDYKAEYDEESHTLKVTYITNKDGVAFSGAFLSNADESDKVRVTFNTTFKINSETGKLAVLERTTKNAENQAVLVYDNGNGEITKKSEIPEVHTGAVSVFKYEDTNGNKKHDEGEKALVGAEFKIALTEADAKAGKFIKINGKELTAVSNEHGIATFAGLEFGGDAKDNQSNLKSGLYKYDWEKASKDYYIVETKTPAGYEKLEDAIKVTVSKNSSEIIDVTEKINEMESVGNKPLKFDLALRKWVTHAYVTENGQTVEYKTGHKAEDNPEDVVKVDLKKSKVNDVTVKFKYSIRITNEGKIAGEAREITDYIPEGLKFVQEDNPDWTTTSDSRIVKTRKLEGTTLAPNESAEVEIMLTWVNGEDTMGVMTNTAEISEDYNEYNVHDIDSTPNNKIPDEDDIDIAQVMLTVTTGSEVIAYTSIALGFITIISLGIIIIKKNI